MFCMKTTAQRSLQRWELNRIHLCLEVNPAVRQEEERALHEARLAKMESDMKAVFQKKVAEKEQKLKKSEAELFARHREMKEQLEKQRQDLEEKKVRLEAGRVVEEKKGRKGFSLR